MTEPVTFTYGEGRYRLTCTAVRCGADINLSVTGGTAPHIGAVSLAVYEPLRDSATVSTVTVFSHRDDVLAAQCAKRVSAALKVTVACSVGIHIDNASSQELALLQENCLACVENILEQLR